MGIEFMSPDALKRYDDHRALAAVDEVMGLQADGPLTAKLVGKIAKLLADERERCAQIAEMHWKDYLVDKEDSWAVGAEMVAKFIRGQD